MNYAVALLYVTYADRSLLTRRERKQTAKAKIDLIYEIMANIAVRHIHTRS
jgi:hypothetical protein